MITVIELFKKSGEVLEEIDSSWKERHPFVVLGYYDFLSVRRTNKFEYIYGQGEAENRDGNLFACYSKYSLVTFDIRTDTDAETDAKNNSEHNLCDELEAGDPKSPYYMIVSCILRDSFYSEKYSDGYDALIDAKKQIYEKLEELNCRLKQKTEPGLRYQLLGNLGIFDITLVTASENLKALHWVSSLLRKIGKTQKGDIHPLIAYSSSFLTYNMEYLKEFGRIAKKSQSSIYNEPIFGLSARMTLYDLRNEKLLSSQLKEYFKSEGMGEAANIRKINGEYDMTMFISGLTIPKLITLLQHEFLNVCTKEYNKHIRSFYALPSCEFESFLYGDNSHQTDNEFYFDERRDEAWKEVTKKRIRLEKAWKEISTPVEIKHTLEACINAAISLSRNNLEYIFGNYLIDLLTSLLINARESQKRIQKLEYPEEKDMQHEIWYNKFAAVIMNVSVMLPNIHPANRLLLDSVEHQDAVNSSIKVMIANREIISEFFRYLGGSKTSKNPFDHIFMTVGSGFNYNSSRFLWPKMPERHKNRPTALLSLNLPSERYLFFEQNMPIFLHELAHYVTLGESDRELRNKALHSVLIAYCEKTLAGEDDFESSKPEDCHTMKHLTDIQSELSDLVKFEWSYEDWVELSTLHCEDFCDEWHDMMQAVLDKAKIRAKQEKFRIRMNYPYKKFIKGLEFLTTNTDYIRVFRRAAIEARCDMILLGWCRVGFGVDNYTTMWYNHYFDVMRLHFRGQLRTPTSIDSSFRYRLAIVIGYFYIRHQRAALADESARYDWEFNAKKFSKWLEMEVSINLSVENRAFVNRYTTDVKYDFPLVFPFAHYLTIAESMFNENISKQVADDMSRDEKSGKLCAEENIAINIAKSAVGGLTHDEELRLYIKAWYKNQLKNKKDKKNEGCVNDVQ